MPPPAARGTKRHRFIGVRAVEREEKGAEWRVRLVLRRLGSFLVFRNGRNLPSKARAAFCFWCRQISVGPLLLLSLLGMTISPLFLWARCLVGAEDFFSAVKLARGRGTCRGDGAARARASEAGWRPRRRGELARRAASPLLAPAPGAQIPAGGPLRTLSCLSRSLFWRAFYG